MKKQILPLLVITFLVSLTAGAQIKKGAVFLGGDLGLSLQHTKVNQPAGFDSKSQNTFINVSPVFGKAVKDNLVIGVDLSYFYTKTESPYPIQKSNSYGAGFFVRKYKDLGKGFYLFGQARLGGAYITQNNTYTANQPPDLEKLRGYNASVNFYPGVSYAVSRKLQLETGFTNLAAVSFNHSKSTFNNGSASVSNNFSLSSSLSNLSGFVLGFRVLLN